MGVRYRYIHNTDPGKGDGVSTCMYSSCCRGTPKDPTTCLHLLALGLNACVTLHGLSVFALQTIRDLF